MTSKPTPASELVKKLQTGIAKYGDYDVVIQLPDGKLCDDFEFSFWTVTLDKEKAKHLRHKQYFIGSPTKLLKIKCS